MKDHFPSVLRTILLERIGVANELSKQVLTALLTFLKASILYLGPVLPYLEAFLKRLSNCLSPLFLLFSAVHTIIAFLILWWADNRNFRLWWNFVSNLGTLVGIILGLSLLSAYLPWLLPAVMGSVLLCRLILIEYYRYERKCFSEAEWQCQEKKLSALKLTYQLLSDQASEQILYHLRWLILSVVLLIAVFSFSLASSVVAFSAGILTTLLYYGNACFEASIAYDKSPDAVRLSMGLVLIEAPDRSDYEKVPHRNHPGFWANQPNMLTGDLIYDHQKLLDWIKACRKNMHQNIARAEALDQMIQWMQGSGEGIPNDVSKQLNEAYPGWQQSFFCEESETKFLASRVQAFGHYYASRQHRLATCNASFSPTRVIA